MEAPKGPPLWVRIPILILFLAIQLAIVGGVVWVMFTYLITPPDFTELQQDLVKMQEGIKQGYAEFMELPPDVRIPMLLGGVSTALFEIAMFLHIRRRVREGRRWRAIGRLAFYCALGFAGVWAGLTIPQQPHLVPLTVFLMTCGTILFQANLMMLIIECLHGLLIKIGLKRDPATEHQPK